VEANSRNITMINIAHDEDLIRIIDDSQEESIFGSKRKNDEYET